MGMFDYVHIDGVSDLEDHASLGQVKCWERTMHTYVIGSEVPSLYGHSTYKIWLADMRGMLVIENNRIARFEHTYPTFDKWGGFLEEEPA